MTLDALIATLLSRLYRQHYGPDRVREFKRDEHHLTQAIARYGHVCAERGWHFEEAEIFADISQLLDRIELAKQGIGFLPAYLEGAIDRHCRLRAEELSERAKDIRTRIERVRSKLPPVAKVVIVAPVVEQLDALWRELRLRGKRRRAARTAASAARHAQATMF